MARMKRARKKPGSAWTLENGVLELKQSLETLRRMLERYMPTRRRTTKAATRRAATRKSRRTTARRTRRPKRAV
jgi:hypothetical protein